MNDLAFVVEAARRRLRTEPGIDVAGVVDCEISRRSPLLDPDGRDALRRTAMAELVGLGPLEHFLALPDVSEVMVNAGNELWIDRDGRPERVGEVAVGQLAGILERIIAPLGLRLDRTHPVVDARLPDGSRLCAVVPPLAPDGICCSIRRFRVRDLALDAMASPAVAALLAELVARRANMVISGATSTGKTTLLNALASHIAPGTRIVTIEDTAELRLAAEHVVRLEARVGDQYAAGGATVRDLVRAALRLRPDRLVVGEVRGAEALDMLQALNTGHDGSLTTCHANSAADALRRLDAMVLMAAPTWPATVAREQVHAALDVIVHLERDARGERRVASVAEVVPPESIVDGERTRVLADRTRHRRPTDEESQVTGWAAVRRGGRGSRDCAGTVGPRAERSARSPVAASPPHQCAAARRPRRRRPAPPGRGAVHGIARRVASTARSRPRRGSRRSTVWPAPPRPDLRSGQALDDEGTSRRGGADARRVGPPADRWPVGRRGVGGARPT